LLTCKRPITCLECFYTQNRWAIPYPEARAAERFPVPGVDSSRPPRRRLSSRTLFSPNVWHQPIVVLDG